MNFKKYLPVENYTLITTLTPVEVLRRLSEKIEPKRKFQLPAFNADPAKPYEGEISRDSFRISRIIDYRNSFLPVIEGNISTFLGQTQINIKMKLATFVLVFICFWLGIVGMACIGVILIGLLKIKEILHAGFSPMFLIPFGMFIFGYLLTMFAFKAESKKSKEFLSVLLNGK